LAGSDSPSPERLKERIFCSTQEQKELKRIWNIKEKNTKCLRPEKI